MAEYTTHYNLKKPAKNENYNIDVANQNNDIIDEKLYGKVDKKAGKDLSTNDFTNEYKKKLDTLKNYDDAEVIKQITSFNERAGKVEEANTEISKNVEALKTDNETNKTAISELKETTAQNSETITAIQEEQTTQNENIEKNATAIEQNKESADEEISKLKEEKDILKSQIPTGTASGNSIHLGDSSNMDFEWKLRGKSYQKVKPYNNLVKNADFKSDLNEWKASSKFSVVNKNGIKYLKISTSTAGFNRAYQGLNTIAEHKYYVAMKCIKDKAWVSAELFLSVSLSDNYPQPAKSITSNIYQNETSVSTILVPKSSNCSIGVMFQSSNTDEVWEAYLRDFICIDLTELYGEGNEPDQTTCDNLFTFDKVAYGTSPSAYTLSQIENVGNNTNLYDKNNPNILNTPIDSNGTGVNVQDTYKTIWIPCKPNTTYTVSKIFDETKNRFGVGYSSIEPNYSQAVEGYISNEKANVLTVTTNATAKYLLAYVWIKGSSTTYEEMLDSIKIEEGEATSYSKYNCGSLGVTISNKNLYKVEKIINDNNYSKIIYKDENGAVSFTTGGVPLIIAPTTIKEKTEYTYILKCKSNVTTENNINFMGMYEDGTKELLSANKKKDTNEFIVKFKTDKEKTLAYVTQQYTNSARTTIITEGTMILEGDYLNLDESYIPHEEQAIIFLLTEGQKLYEGSYLAADGIHNTRRQDILTGEESLQNYHSDTSNGFVGFSFIMSKKHKKNADFLCTHLTKNGDNVYYNRGLGGWLPDEDRWCYICVPISILKDVSTAEKQIESMKEYLTEQYNAGTPMKFEYELATEEIILYTPEQQAVIDKILYTYKNVTNISVDNKLATLDITYKKDIETMFNNQAKEYNERLSNIENLLNTTETSALLLDNLENDLEKEV